jgi:hypothetical protein
VITGVLLLLPAALLFASLILGRYPGEEALDVARRLVRAPRLRPQSIVLAPRRPARAHAAIAGLVAAALTPRAPPCG